MKWEAQMLSDGRKEEVEKLHKHQLEEKKEQQRKMLEEGKIEIMKPPYLSEGEYVKVHYFDKFGRYTDKENASTVQIDTYNSHGVQINQEIIHNAAVKITNADFKNK